MDPRYEGLTGEPDALKGASPVRRGAVGKGLHRQYLAGRLPYFSSAKGASQGDCLDNSVLDTSASLPSSQYKSVHIASKFLPQLTIDS